MAGRTSRLSLLLLFTCIALSPASGEEIRMRDGSTVDRKILRIGAGEVVFHDGSRMPLSKIARIECAKVKADVSKPKPIEGQAQGTLSKDWKRLQEDAVSFAKDYPQASALILRDYITVTLEKNCSFKKVTRVACLIQKEDHLGLAQVSSMYFFDGRSRARLIRAEALHPDGTMTCVDPETIKAICPPKFGKFVLNYKLMPFVIPGVKVGSIIDYEVEFEEYNPMRDDFFFDKCAFQGTLPILHSRYEIDCPREMELNYRARNFDSVGGQHNDKTVSKRRKLVWELRNVAPIVMEPAMIQIPDIAPFLRVSTLADWGPVMEFCRGVFGPRSIPTPELSAFTLELTKDLSTAPEKTARIYRYLQDKIRYVAVKLGNIYFAPRADETWKNGYGCCIDKALLFTAMLSAVDIESYVVLLDGQSSPELDATIPTIQLDHAISLVKLDGKLIYLDATGNDARFPICQMWDQGVVSIIPALNKLSRTPMSPADENLFDHIWDLALEESGELRGTCARRPTGTPELWMRAYLKSLKPEDRTRYFQSRVSSWSDGGKLIKGEVTNVQDLTKPLLMDLAFEFPNYPERAGPIVIFSVPGLEARLGRFGEISLPTRNYPIEIHGLTGIRHRYRLKVPASYGIKHLPRPLHLANPWFTVNARYEWNAPNLALDIEFKRLSRLVKTEDYARYRRELLEVTQFSRKRVFFEEKGGAR